MKKDASIIMLAFGILFLLIGIWLKINIGIGIISLSFGTILTILSIVFICEYNGNQKRIQKNNAIYAKIQNDDINLINSQNGFPVFPNCSAMLKYNENCYFESPATFESVSNKEIRIQSNNYQFYTNNGFFASIPMSSGVSNSKIIRGDVRDVDNGTLIITNHRIISIARKYGFDLKYSDITSLRPLYNGFQIQFGSANLNVYLTRAAYSNAVIRNFSTQ